ncbi:MAG: hypothetical protein R6V46_06325 [Desulfatiglandaceae bacterium]
MNYYVHNVPGRLRVKIPKIKSSKRHCRKVERLFRDLDGIENAAVNELTGSVVIHYDTSIRQPEEILAIFEENDYLDKSQVMSNEKHLQTAAAKAGQAVGRALFGWAIGRALEANGLSFLAILI